MDAAAAPCRVRRVHIVGLQHTREEVVRAELGVLDDPNANTLGAIGERCLDIAGALRSLDIFEAADLLVDAAPSSAATGPLADVTVTVKEKKRLTSASTGVSTQSGEGSLDANVAVRNLLGWAERLELNMELGQQKSSAFQLSATRPRMMGTAAQLTADLTKSATSYLKHSSFVEKLVGGGVACKFGSADGPSGAHDFGYRLQLRDVCKLPQGVASWSILQQRGASLKSALSHTFAATRLDEPMAPTSGGAIRLHTELAGVAPPLGDVSFVKQTLTASAFVPLLPAGRVAVGAFLNAGLLLPLGQNAKRESSVCDRFFLGGPGSLWGFRTRGCGPRELRHNPTGAALGERAPRDTLGGDVMAVATGIVSVALPGSKLEAARVRAHAFGSVGGLTTLSALNAAGGSFAPSLRACAGIGIAVPTAVGRVELNLTHVLRHAPDDALARNGLQIGISPGFA